MYRVSQAGQVSLKTFQDFNISTKGNNIPKPLRYWHEAAISDDILEVIKECNYEVSR